MWSVAWGVTARSQGLEFGHHQNSLSPRAAGWGHTGGVAEVSVLSCSGWSGTDRLGSGAHETDGDSHRRGPRSLKAGGFHLPSVPVFLRLCYSLVASLTGWVSLLFSLDICIKRNYPSGNYSPITEAGSSVLQLWIPLEKRETAFCAAGLGQPEQEGVWVSSSPALWFSWSASRSLKGPIKAFL